MYMRKRQKNTRYQYRDTRKIADALLLLNELHKNEEQPEKVWLIDVFVVSILKFCCFMCGVKYDEKQM